VYDTAGKLVAERMINTRDLAVGKDVLLAPSSDDGLSAYQLPSLAPAKFPIKTDETHLMFDRTGDHVVVPTGDDGLLFDAHTGAPLARLVTGSTVNRVRFDHHARRVLTYGEDRVTRAWTTETGTQLAFVDSASEGAFAISDDGTRFATGYLDGTIKIWETETGRLLQTIRAHRKKIIELWFAVDDTRLVSWGDDWYATIFDVHLEHRDPAAIADLATRHAGWVFQRGQLVRK
jgi:WD40 repeat protein